MSEWKQEKPEVWIRRYPDGHVGQAFLDGSGSLNEPTKHEKLVLKRYGSFEDRGPKYLGIAQQRIDDEWERREKVGESSDLNLIAKQALEKCKRKRWSRDWSEAGCYLHLEVSEFIEALRGKGDTTPTQEAADVLFVLLSTMRHHGISTHEVLDEVRRLVKE